MEEHGRIDERTAVDVENEFARGVVVTEDLHLKTRRGWIFLLREIPSEISWHPYGAAVLAATMFQLFHHLFWRGVAQRFEHQSQIFFREGNPRVHV